MALANKMAIRNMPCVLRHNGCHWSWRRKYLSAATVLVIIYEILFRPPIESTLLLLPSPATSLSSSPVTVENIIGTRFIPVVATDDRTWTLPNTRFTQHILSLVDFYEHCSSNNEKGARIAISVQSHASSPVITIVGDENRLGVSYQKAFEQIFNSHSDKYSSHQRVLPAGNITLYVARSDKCQITDQCYFANSAPGGIHSIFNMQDVYRWAHNSSYPKPLPWEERHAIPVFRGSARGVDRSYLKTLRKELDDNIKSGMTPEKAGSIFFHNIANQGKEKEHHQRMNLVHFSKLHPELLDARFHHGNQKRERDFLWEHNSTNGMHRVLPFDPIAEDKYYTEYQTHLVMGGIGAAFRTARILGQMVTVVLQAYPYEEWFFRYMKPFVHYIPLDQDLSNLNETLHWVKDNSDKVLQIAKNGKAFFDEHLSYDRMDEFYYELIFRLMLCCGR
ncbi:hypothetical protein ACHAWF_013187 [Thalassiosira exigua]